MSSDSTRPSHLTWVILRCLVGVLVVGKGTTPIVARAQVETGLVRVTPIGSQAGELCRDDRALLFEDPTGVRILYDPGRTTDDTDPRLGDVNVMLLSHAHTDHIGDVRPNRGAGTCAAPSTGAANPNSNFATIAAVKNAVVFAPGELSDFLSQKIQAARGSATPGCAAVGLDNETAVPASAPCTASLRPGGSRTVRRGSAAAAVRVVVVPAFHSNGIPPSVLDAPGVAPGTRGYGGGEGGFVIRFTNGLVAYLTGDSGMFGDMDTIIKRFYGPNLLVINMSDTATFGPDEAAFVVQHLVRTTTGMPSHVNEQATTDGVERAGTRVERFSRQARPFADVVLPLSGVTRFFDGDGRCIGCR